MSKIYTTKEQREIMQNALGRRMKRGKAVKDSRNHFVTGSGDPAYDECKKLVEMGLMVERSVSWVTDSVFMVTDSGKDEL